MGRYNEKLDEKKPLEPHFEGVISRGKSNFKREIIPRFRCDITEVHVNQSLFQTNKTEQRFTLLK